MCVCVCVCVCVFVCVCVCVFLLLCGNMTKVRCPLLGYSFFFLRGFYSLSRGQL